MIKVFESPAFWSTILGVISTLTAAWLSYFLTKRSMKFASQVETVLEMRTALLETRSEVDEIEGQFIKHALDSDTFDQTMKASQKIYDALHNHLYLLAVQANDKKLYALIYCAQNRVWKASGSAIEVYQHEGSEAAAENIRFELAGEIDDLLEQLDKYLAEMRFHKNSLRKHERDCKANNETN